MSNYQNANYFLNLIHTGQYSELFNLLDKHYLPKLSDSQQTTYHNFKSEFINGINDIQYSQRLSTFITGEVFRITNNQMPHANNTLQDENTSSEKPKRHFNIKIVISVSVILGVMFIYKDSSLFNPNSQKPTDVLNKEKTIKLRGNVSKESGQPAVGAKAEIIGRTWQDYTDDSGNFSLKLNGKSKQQFTLRITCRSYLSKDKKVEVDFNSSAAFQDLPMIRLEKKKKTKPTISGKTTPTPKLINQGVKIEEYKIVVNGESPISLSTFIEAFQDLFSTKLNQVNAGKTINFKFSEKIYQNPINNNEYRFNSGYLIVLMNGKSLEFNNIQISRLYYYNSKVKTEAALRERIEEVVRKHQDVILQKLKNHLV